MKKLLKKTAKIIFAVTVSLSCVKLGEIALTARVYHLKRRKK